MVRHALMTRATHFEHRSETGMAGIVFRKSQTWLMVMAIMKVLHGASPKNSKSCAILTVCDMIQVLPHVVVSVAIWFRGQPGARCIWCGRRQRQQGFSIFACILKFATNDYGILCSLGRECTMSRECTK